ncbi:LOW QUALITY PROTEIN: hypothetical protein YC2023_002079 [Brassica napus]
MEKLAHPQIKVSQVTDVHKVSKNQHIPKEKEIQGKNRAKYKTTSRQYNSKETQILSVGVVEQQDQRTRVQTIALPINYGKKWLQKVFSMVHDVSSNMDLIERLGVKQSDMHSHMVVELSASMAPIGNHSLIAESR